MVCAVAIPLHSLYQGSPTYGPRAKPDLRSHLTRPHNQGCGVRSPVIRLRLRLLAISILRLQLRLQLRLRAGISYLK